MSDYTPEDIVKYSLSGDGVRAKEAIQGVLANKIVDGLEAKKAEIAQTMFNGVTAAQMNTTHDVLHPERDENY